MRVSHAIAFVSDMKRSTAFSRDVFGRALRFDSPLDPDGLAISVGATPRRT